MAAKDVVWIAVCNIDGETAVLKATGTQKEELMRRHIQQTNSEMQILSIVRADLKDPIGHLVRVKKMVEDGLPAGESLMTDERFTELAKAAIEAKNAENALKLP